MSPTGRLDAGRRATVRWWRGLGWVGRALYVAGAIEFVLATINYYHGSGPDLYRIHVAIKAFLHGGRPYADTMFVNPPSACLALLPVGLDGWRAVHVAFHLLQMGAIAVGGALCLRMVGLRWAGAAGGVLLLVLSELPAVRLTMLLENVNGVVFVLGAASLAALLAGRWDASGVLLGLSLAIKPILIPLLVVPLLLRRWRGLALAVGVPVVLSGLAAVADPHLLTFFDRQLRFLLNGNAQHLRGANVSIVGAFHILSLPRAAAEAVRYATLALALWLAWMRWQEDDRKPGETGPGALRVLEVTGILLLAAILCFSFSWVYYGIYLLPLLVSIVLPGSLLRNVPAAVGILLMASPIPLSLDRYAHSTHVFQQVRPTLAWLLILVGMGCGLRRASRAEVVAAPA